MSILTLPPCALDPLAASVPPTFTFVGPIQETLPPSGWRSPWPADDPRPLVLVSFSAGFAWDQTSRIQRTLDGLAERPVRVLVTPSMTDTTLMRIPANASIVHFIPHAEVLPQTAALVTHAGHGTVIAALAHGVLLVCLPNTTSDQPATAAQVAAQGAGIALDGDGAPPEAIGEAVMRVLGEPSYARAAWPRRLPPPARPRPPWRGWKRCVYAKSCCISSRVNRSSNSLPGCV